MDEELEIASPLKIFSTTRGTRYDVYLQEIQDPAYFTELLMVLQEATEDDVLTFHVNSAGGSLQSTIQLYNAIQGTEAHVVMSLEGFVMSAGSILMLSASEWVVMPNLMALVHNFSAGVAGKQAEMYSQVAFEKLWVEKYFADIYKDFLTEAEIKAVLAGQDMWLSSDDLQERLKRVIAAREKSLKKSNGKT